MNQISVIFYHNKPSDITKEKYQYIDINSSKILHVGLIIDGYILDYTHMHMSNNKEYVEEYLNPKGRQVTIVHIERNLSCEELYDIMKIKYPFHDFPRYFRTREPSPRMILGYELTCSQRVAKLLKLDKFWEYDSDTLYEYLMK